MFSIFIYIYQLLKKLDKRFRLFLIPVILFIGYTINNVVIEEDISALMPADARIAEMGNTFMSSSFADQIIFNVYYKDTAVSNPQGLTDMIDSLSAFLSKDTLLVKNVRSKVDEQAYSEVYEYFYRYLPYYMTDEDYRHLDTMMTGYNLDQLMLSNYKAIISPTGFGTGRYILKDPFSLVFRSLKKLQSFQLDDNFTTWQSHILTKDSKHALCFLAPANSSKNTKENRKLVQAIDEYLKQHVPAEMNVDYYGGTVVAVANSNRVQKDITLTVSIALFLLVLLFVFVFKKFRILFVLFLPVVFGVGISLTVLSFMYDSLSAISLGVGAVLLGISVDYSLHYFSHARLGHTPKSILKSIADPVMMSSLTTASAFFCLYVVQSKALNQLGLFAGFSVIFTSVLVLVILPFIFRVKTKNNKNEKLSEGLFDRIAAVNFDHNKYLLISVFLLSVVFFITGRYVKFDADISHVNYLSPELKQSEDNLKKISSEAASAIFVLTKGKTLDEALTIFDTNASTLDSLVAKGIVEKLTLPNAILLSQQNQQAKKEQWKNFWKSKGIDASVEMIGKAAVKNHFKENTFANFDKMIQEDVPEIDPKDVAFMQDLFLRNQIQESADYTRVAAICKVDQSRRNEFYQAVSKLPGLMVLDKSFYINRFFEVLKDDFSLLINYSMIVVFIIVLLFWGRFELTLITFIPIILSWQWTTGLMVLLGIEFNIFNIIICTFIFGLGIDYSIFLTQGLINDYKYGTKSLLPYKVSILLSMATTLIGVGVLIFAQHPALKSIALVTVLGILSVVVITFTILPFLFRLLVYNKGQKRVFPIILMDIVVSITSFAVFLIGVIVLSLLVMLFKWTPFLQRQKKNLIHYLLFITCKVVVGMNVLFKREYIDRFKFDLSNPALIICNHQSHLDIALLLMLNPRIIVMTNKWVWKNPFYGFIIRYCDFYPIYTGIEQAYDKIKRKVDQGYSVLMYPEGTRTKDGNIGRFHQGAFSMADYLGLDILPVLLHGAFECMPKTEFFLRAGHITIQFFDRIKVNKPDLENGITYRPQAKSVTAFYRKQYALLKERQGTVDFYSRRLKNQYVYKGPVLEWYTRIKLSLEGNYRFYDELLPVKGKIIDVGCGYGYMMNMLKLTKPQRELVGWDYDENKIAVAKEVAGRSGVRFEVKDVVCDSLENADAYVFNDVLHYFNKELQNKVLQKVYEVLNQGGQIIIRDADSELQKRTKVTKITEWWSIKVLKFNKMEYEVDYLSASRIRDFAEQKDMKMERIDNARYTSNVVFILTKTN